MSTAQAAAEAGIPRLIPATLAPARSAEDLAQGLEFLARHYQTRVNRAEILLRAAYIPLVVGVMGICVGFVALSLFQPLVDLIKVTGTFGARP
jgi:type II secretory pathway component PulF